MQIEIKKNQEDNYTMTIKVEAKAWRMDSLRGDFAQERLLFPPQTELQNVVNRLKESNVIASTRYNSMSDSEAMTWRMDKNEIVIDGNEKAMINVLFVLYQDRFIDDTEFKVYRSALSPKVEEPQHCCTIL